MKIKIVQQFALVPRLVFTFLLSISVSFASRLFPSFTKPHRHMSQLGREHLIITRPDLQTNREAVSLSWKNFAEQKFPYCFFLLIEHRLSWNWTTKRTAAAKNVNYTLFGGDEKRLNNRLNANHKLWLQIYCEKKIIFNQLREKKQSKIKISFHVEIYFT